ncbi:hypothetical protein AJ87_08850 [Rhizobium yanglingense]|nr:hypothetical protein AJ87_08850 [Rhizobium yanglingense]
MLIGGLRLDKAHFRLTGPNDDCLGIGRFVLLPLHERAHILRRDQLDCMAPLHQLARPVMGAAANFHNNKRRWLL